ncbi:two-component system sensor histidine kinase BprS [Rothia nasimurium]|uniref:histidine kinase n=1 Tax=Luteibacter anthropi TaxID=564369 RepID=A0A7X5U7B9_9GAMM|nr:ATP-binding protein [Luteibacter anthropi]NII05127.1 two-component sensor histidine kinase [Luteibacter anthropi]
MLRTFYKLYLFLILGLATAAVVVVPAMQYVLLIRLSPSDAEDLRSTMYVLRDMLAKQDAARRQKTLDEVQPSLAMIRFELMDRARISLSEEQGRQLDLGYAVDMGPDDILLAILPSHQVLHTQQIRSLGSSTVFRLLAWSMVAAVMLGGLFLWLRSHWRDLEILREAAQRFGDGELHVRSGLPARSSVAPLATRFDSMASRIQTLVSTQSEMINAISHELRTPIARFGFALALLKSSDDEDERRRYIDMMSEDIGELDQLVSELLSYGALGQPGREPERCKVNVTEFIDSVTGSLALEMELRDIHCHVSVFPADAVAQFDPKLTARALMNLIRNAMRYGRSHIDITATMERGILVIRVDDDGIGIPAADRKSIFEPFHRLDRSRDRSTGGFGLGLAIVRRAITSQGGHVDVGDSPTGGARFTLHLPL